MDFVFKGWVALCLIFFVPIQAAHPGSMALPKSNIEIELQEAWNDYRSDFAMYKQEIEKEKKKLDSWAKKNFLLKALSNEPISPELEPLLDDLEYLQKPEYNNPSENQLRMLDQLLESKEKQVQKMLEEKIDDRYIEFNNRLIEKMKERIALKKRLLQNKNKENEKGLEVLEDSIRFTRHEMLPAFINVDIGFLMEINKKLTNLRNSIVWLRFMIQQYKEKYIFRDDAAQLKQYSNREQAKVNKSGEDQYPQSEEGAQ